MVNTLKHTLMLILVVVIISFGATATAQIPIVQLEAMSANPPAGATETEDPEEEQKNEPSGGSAELGIIIPFIALFASAAVFLVVSNVFKKRNKYFCRTRR